MWFRALLVILFGWSFVAVWGISLAEQAFPSDAILNPLLDYALPNWLIGNIARNAGTLIGLEGVFSLAPLFAMLGVLALSLFLKARGSASVSEGTPVNQSQSLQKPVI